MFYSIALHGLKAVAITNHISFLLKFLIAKNNGTTAHTNIIPMVNNMPLKLPKKSWYKAPVYPINALTSIFSMIKILQRSIGLRADNTNVNFSRG